MRLEVNLQHQRQVVVLIDLPVHNLNNNQLSSNSSNNISVGLTHLAVILNSLPAVSTHLQVGLQFNNNKFNPKVLMHLVRNRNNNNNNNRSSMQAASVRLAHHHPYLNNREDSMHLVVLKPNNQRPNKVHSERLETQQLQLFQILMLLAISAHHQVG
jgi:hypothetical protein